MLLLSGCDILYSFNNTIPEDGISDREDGVSDRIKWSTEFDTKYTLEGLAVDESGTIYALSRYMNDTGQRGKLHAVGSDGQTKWSVNIGVSSRSQAPSQYFLH